MARKRYSDEDRRDTFWLRDDTPARHQIPRDNLFESLEQQRRPCVRSWLKAGIQTRQIDVRFTSGSEHVTRGGRRPLTTRYRW